jgi:hypothetical protein
MGKPVIVIPDLGHDYGTFGQTPRRRVRRTALFSADGAIPRVYGPPSTT